MARGRASASGPAGPPGAGRACSRRSGRTPATRSAGRCRSPSRSSSPAPTRTRPGSPSSTARVVGHVAVSRVGPGLEADLWMRGHRAPARGAGGGRRCCSSTTRRRPGRRQGAARDGGRARSASRAARRCSTSSGDRPAGRALPAHGWQVVGEGRPWWLPARPPARAVHGAARLTRIGAPEALTTAASAPIGCGHDRPRRPRRGPRRRSTPPPTAAAPSASPRG